jgi:hypothetical protein
MHSDLIKSLKSAYGEAAEGLEEYSKKSEKVYQTQLIADQQRVLAALSSEVRNLVNNFTQAQPPMDELSMLFGDLNNKSLILRRGFEDFTGPLNQLQSQLQGGSINVTEFRDAIDKIAIQLKNEGSPAAIEYADKLLEASKKMAILAAQAGITAPAIDVVTGAMQRGMAASKAFSEAIKGMEGLAPEKISNRTQLEKFLKQAEFNAKDEEEYRRAVQAGEAARKRIEAEEAAKAATGGVGDEERLRREQEMIAKRLEVLTLGWGKEEEQLAAHLARNQNLINLAREKEVVDDETHKILMQGAEEEYQKRIQAIRDRVNNQALSSTASMFGSLMSLTQTFGKKGTGLAKTFGIAQALINTYVGVTKALSTLPPPASYAAAAATLASGMAQVASIRSISDSGAGGGGRTASSAGAGSMASAANSAGGGGGQPGGNSVYINLQGQSFGRDQVRDLIKQIASYQKDGGQVVFA